MPSPCSTVPRTLKGRPNIAVASSMFPRCTAVLMRVLEIISPCAIFGRATVTDRGEPLLRRASSGGCPWPRCPKRQFSPTTSSARGGEMARSWAAKSSASVAANAFVNGSTRQPSRSSRSRILNLCGVAVSRGGAAVGLSTRMGCGSKVKSQASPLMARALEIVWSMTLRWPWCTPSKNPAAATTGAVMVRRASRLWRMFMSQTGGSEESVPARLFRSCPGDPGAGSSG